MQKVHRCLKCSPWNPMLRNCSDICSETVYKLRNPAVWSVLGSSVPVASPFGSTNHICSFLSNVGVVTPHAVTPRSCCAFSPKGLAQDHQGSLWQRRGLYPRFMPLQQDTNTNFQPYEKCCGPGKNKHTRSIAGYSVYQERKRQSQSCQHLEAKSLFLLVHEGMGLWGGREQEASEKVKLTFEKKPQKPKTKTASGPNEEWRI